VRIGMSSVCCPVTSKGIIQMSNGGWIGSNSIATTAHCNTVVPKPIETAALYLRGDGVRPVQGARGGMREKAC